MSQIILLTKESLEAKIKALRMLSDQSIIAAIQHDGAANALEALLVEHDMALKENTTTTLNG